MKITKSLRIKNILFVALSLFIIFDFSFAANNINGCLNDLRSPIKNFCEVVPGELWRGARPDANGTIWLIEHNVKTIVNLELLHDDRFTFVKSNISGSSEHDIDYFHVADWELNAFCCPRLLDDHVAHFLAIMIRQPKPIFVHCRQGANRTGVFIASYRVIEEGMSIDNAIREMKSYDGMFFALDARYIHTLTPERQKIIRQKTKEWIAKLKRTSHIHCQNGRCEMLKD